MQFAPFGPATRLPAERGISSASLQFTFRKPNITSERFGNLPPVSPCQGGGSGAGRITGIHEPRTGGRRGRVVDRPIVRLAPAAMLGRYMKDM